MQVQNQRISKASHVAVASSNWLDSANANLQKAWFEEAVLQDARLDSFSYRLLNLVCAVLILLATVPVMLLTMLVIRCVSRGPVFYKQKRMGLHGKLFWIHKFRTMVVDAEKDSGAVWAREDDDRIIPFGETIRKARIDELPQLWNVIKGDMNLIGPRPERPEFLNELCLEVPNYRDRFVIKPGITGWAQVNNGYTASADATREKCAHDFYYIRNRSLPLDFKIAVKTVKVLFTGHGAR